MAEYEEDEEQLFFEQEEIEEIPAGTPDLAFEDIMFGGAMENLQLDDTPDSQQQNDEDTTYHDPEEDEPPMDPSTSKMTLQDWKLLKVVGKGGFGKVYQVSRVSDSEIFAMKALRKDFLIKTKNVEYTKTEKDILRKVRHPFIVSLHYAFQVHKNVCLYILTYSAECWQSVLGDGLRQWWSTAIPPA